MKIIVDAMGGDNAPGAIVQGALDANRTHGLEILLVGRTEEILRAVEACGEKSLPAGVEIKGATEVVEIADDPATAFKMKKDSSLTVGLNLLKEGAGDAFVSAGSTGALLAGATLVTKRIRGIRRAALAPVIPNGGKGVMLIDCGANVECTSEYLLQFAFMGSFYSKHILGCANPRVGLLNNGTEETKGTELQKQAYTLLKRVSDEGRINFIGNIEGSAALSGEVDVIVTDGFTGNILLKGCEGMIKFLMGQLKGVFLSSTKNKLAALMLKSDFAKLKDMMDVNKIGGTALLGISKPVIKAHGSSNDEAVFSAIRQAVRFAQAGVIEEIENNIEYMRLATGETEKTEV